MRKADDTGRLTLKRLVKLLQSLKDPDRGGTYTVADNPRQQISRGSNLKIES